MCMTCGCGDVDLRHQPTDITREDLQRAADGAGVPIRQAARNLEASSRDVADGRGKPTGGLRPWAEPGPKPA